MKEYLANPEAFAATAPAAAEPAPEAAAAAPAEAAKEEEKEESDDDMVGSDRLFPVSMLTRCAGLRSVRLGASRGHVEYESDERVWQACISS